jgi:hypothetical protein
LYLLLEKNLAIASYTKALEFRNDKSFRRVTEEGYIHQYSGQFFEERSHLRISLLGKELPSTVGRTETNAWGETNVYLIAGK